MYGATENIMLSSVFAEGITVISNAAKEPEILDLQNFLNKMGAKITGAGTDKIQIEGVKKLKEVSYNIMFDRIEAGTYMCYISSTGGDGEIENIDSKFIVPVINKLEEAGCKIEIKKRKIKLSAPKRLKAVDIKTLPYPGFPTDLQSIFTAMLSTAKGTSVVVENIFENRFKNIEELNKMGTKITVEGRSCVIRGTRKLYGTNVKASDLRGGASLILAALVAKGRTQIESSDYILRGYEKLEKKLESIGADINIYN